MYDLDFLKNYKGRIWLINTTHYSLYDMIKEQFEVNLIDQKAFNVEYKKYEYTLTLIEID